MQLCLWRFCVCVCTYASGSWAVCCVYSVQLVSVQTLGLASWLWAGLRITEANRPPVEHTLSHSGILLGGHDVAVVVVAIIVIVNAIGGVLWSFGGGPLKSTRGHHQDGATREARADLVRGQRLLG